MENRPALLSLLSPVNRAVKSSTLASNWSNRAMCSGRSPGRRPRRTASCKTFRDSKRAACWCGCPTGRAPGRPPRPVVNINVGQRRAGILSADALLDFSVDVALEGEALNDKELKQLLKSSDDLVWLKGAGSKLTALNCARRWHIGRKSNAKRAMADSRSSKVCGCFQASASRWARVAPPADTVDWTGITAGPALEATLRELHTAHSTTAGNRPDCRPGYGLISGRARLAAIHDPIGAGAAGR